MPTRLMMQNHPLSHIFCGEGVYQPFQRGHAIMVLVLSYENEGGGKHDNMPKTLTLSMMTGVSSPNIRGSRISRVSCGSRGSRVFFVFFFFFFFVFCCCRTCRGSPGSRCCDHNRVRCTDLWQHAVGGINLFAKFCTCS
eukprot:gnl/TRDRNA2_/TRDRNA2_173754_c1_seq5.p1 gnl/TRDRNA2_/TRDRNA2_173754_c1~~gnl/TRDRNA2_/TRDRNA2_173754_c1_seq5.p1  ORF type:complete len:139 (+),score=9.53 gnl/TRDRNA2_/TRDRNA2_173754_c1_seq5:1-417(+)